MDNHPADKVINIDSMRYTDVLAMLCFHIHQLPSKEQETLYTETVNSYDKYYKQAIKRYPFLNKPQLDWKVDTRISNLLMLAEDKSIAISAIILGAIGVLDSTLDLTVKAGGDVPVYLTGRECPTDIEDFPSKSYYRITALNSNTAEYGLVLPKIYCSWTKESARTIKNVAHDPLTIALKNLLWVPNCDNWNVSNLFCDFRGVGFKVGDKKNTRDNDNAPQAQSLKIVSSPLDWQAPFTTTLDWNTEKFYLSYFTDNDQRLEMRIKEVIKYAIHQRAEIVCFPEMMGTEALIKECKEIISGYSDCINGPEVYPKLFFLPTREYIQNGQWYNRLDILDDTGKCIFHYFKKHPFTFDKKIGEDNSRINIKFEEPIFPDNKICVIHVPEIGRIGVIICADVFKDNYLQFLMRDLQLTLLIFPVYTKGRDLMERSLAEAHKYSCDVLLCNTCAAWDPKFHPQEESNPSNGFPHDFISVYYPYGHRFPYKQVAELKCTTETCTGCAFLTVIAPRYDDPSVQPAQKTLGGI